VTVLYCDASINHVDEYKPDDYPVMLRTHGGGGTDFRPVFEHTDEHNEDVQCLIYLTDMMGKFPDAEPDYPVMWVSNSKIQEAPFGQVVSLK
jgi:predicted metal-dependent peptidase